MGPHPSPLNGWYGQEEELVFYNENSLTLRAPLGVSMIMATYRVLVRTDCRGGGAGHETKQKDVDMEKDWSEEWGLPEVGRQRERRLVRTVRTRCKRV